MEMKSDVFGMLAIQGSVFVFLLGGLKVFDLEFWLLKLFSNRMKNKNLLFIFGDQKFGRQKLIFSD